MYNARQAYQILRALVDDALTKIGGVAAKIALLGNRAQAQDFVGTAPAAPQFFDLPAPFTTKTGNVRVTVMMSVTGTGGTSVAGEQIKFSFRAAGVLFVTAPVSFQEVGAVELDASATLVFDFIGIGVGTSQTYGVEAQNITTPAHTLAIPALGATVTVEDIL